MPAATMAPMTKRHERPEIPEGYAGGRRLRRGILLALLASTKPIGSFRISRVIESTTPTVQRHAARLEHAGLIEQTGRGFILTRAGREAAYLLNDLKEPLTKPSK